MLKGRFLTKPPFSNYLHTNMTLPANLITYLVAINVITLMAYVLDRYRKGSTYQKLIDKLLFALAVIGGSLGAGFAIFIGRMKIGNPHFRLVIPVLFFLQLIILLIAY